MKLFEEMSYDLDFRRPKVIVCDNLVLLENVTAIAMLSETSITVRGQRGYTTVTGRDFVIKEICEGRLRIEGEIQGIELSR